VDEDEHGRAGLLHEEIDAVSLRVAIAQIQVLGPLRREPIAARLPVRDNPAAIGDGGAVVVAGIKRRPIHAPVKNHG